jgi:hypothetical protein
METLAIRLMALAPVYIVIGLIMGVYGVPGPIVLAPILLLVAAGAYLATRKCRRCQAPLYAATKELWLSPVAECPACGRDPR